MTTTDTTEFCLASLVRVFKCDNKIVYGVWECSYCGEEYEETSNGYIFCPHCGRKIGLHLKGDYDVVYLGDNSTDPQRKSTNPQRKPA